jgi:hypothetical protein
LKPGDDGAIAAILAKPTCTKNSAFNPMTAMTRDHGDDGDFPVALPFFFAYNRALWRMKEQKRSRQLIWR